MSTALIAGATGMVGNSLLHLLLESDSYSKVISFGRRELSFSHPKLTQRIVDFENLEGEAFQVDRVFCCLGTTIKNAGSQEAFRKVDLEFPVYLAKYSIEQGAKSYHLITAMGANSKSSFFYNRIKGEVEEAIKKMPFEQIHIYRPSLILGERNERRVAEKIAQVVMKALGILLVGPFKNYKGIEGQKVARSMLGNSLSSNKGGFVHLSGEMQELYK